MVHVIETLFPYYTKSLIYITTLAFIFSTEWFSIDKKQNLYVSHSLWMFHSFETVGTEATPVYKMPRLLLSILKQFVFSLSLTCNLDRSSEGGSRVKGQVSTVVADLRFVLGGRIRTAADSRLPTLGQFVKVDVFSSGRHRRILLCGLVLNTGMCNFQSWYSRLLFLPDRLVHRWWWSS